MWNVFYNFKQVTQSLIHKRLQVKLFFILLFPKSSQVNRPKHHFRDLKINFYPGRTKRQKTTLLPNYLFVNKMSVISKAVLNRVNLITGK